jgi:hypothetical protein
LLSLQESETLVHVVQVMDRVVNHVPGERLDREPGAIAPAARAKPLVGHELIKTLSKLGGRVIELDCNLGGSLGVVAPFER